MHKKKFHKNSKVLCQLKNCFCAGCITKTKRTRIVHGIIVNAEVQINGVNERQTQMMNAWMSLTTTTTKKGTENKQKSLGQMKSFFFALGI